MIVRVVTLGCKVNQCESASIVAALRERNIDASEGLNPADVYILNTCSVTAEADRKSRQYLSKMRAQNPQCKIIVLGCSSQNNRDNFAKANVIAVGGTANKSEFVISIIDDLLDECNCSILSDRILFDENAAKIGKIIEYCHEKHPISDKTRAFVKIQDGCNRFCSYCIIPYLRGRSRSRAIDDIVAECKNCGSREIVLTGIDVSSYGRDLRIAPIDLLYALKDINARKRLSSFECELIDDDFLRAMGDCGFCPHFHMSLQSGSDEVLRSMNRRYDTKYYYEKVELIRKYFPLAGITTDVIVGFPTETDDFFESGIEFIKKCSFSDIHVFPYSSRTGTLASKKYSVLPAEVKNNRKTHLLELKKQLHDDFVCKNIGSIAEVYTEDADSGYNVGYTPNYIKVYSTAPQGSFIPIKLVKPYKDGIYGELI